MGLPDTVVSIGNERETRYYHGSGQAHDHLLRCADCKALVPLTTLKSLGCCTCGCKRVKEITTLSDAEQILVAELDFPHKAEFLQEFAPVVLD